jgi:hypothetical protein
VGAERTVNTFKTCFIPRSVSPPPLPFSDSVAYESTEEVSI